MPLLPSAERPPAWQRLLRHRGATAGMMLLSALALAALCAPWLAPRDPIAQDLTRALSAPRWGGALFGTDHLGRDLLSRLLYGARVSLLVGLSAVLLGGVVGCTLGMVGAHYGGWFDRMLVLLIDAFLSFPTLLIALAFIALLGSGLFNVVLAIALAAWPGVARVLRGQVMSVRERDFVFAARANGAGDAHILRRHVLPNTWGPLAVMLTLSVGTAILSEATLGFLGLGVPLPAPTWGRIVGDAVGYMRIAPWALAFGGLAISLTVLALNLLGDGLRDLLDPTARRAT